MDSTLERLIDTLDDKCVMYVFERSNTHTDKEALENCKMSRNWWFKKPAEEREEMNDIASKIRKDRLFKGNQKLADAFEQAVDVKLEALKYSDKRLRQSAATEIIDRNIGKPTQKAEVKADITESFIIVEHEDDSKD